MSIFNSIDNQPRLQLPNDERAQACSFQVLKASQVYDYAGNKIALPDEFFDFILLGIQEQHSDATSIKNVLSDSYCAFATGANPVQILLQGMLPMTLTFDHRLDFHELYNSYFRGTKLKQQKLLLRIFVKQTVFNLYIQSINMGVSSQVEDMATFSINGIGYAYRVNLAKTE